MKLHDRQLEQQTTESFHHASEVVLVAQKKHSQQALRRIKQHTYGKPPIVPMGRLHSQNYPL